MASIAALAVLGTPVFPAWLVDCGSYTWDAIITMTLWLCHFIVAALAYGRIRKTKAMSAPHISCWFPGAWLC